MKEVTSIVTIQITAITKHEDEHVERYIAENQKEENVRAFEADLKEIFRNADDVKVTNIRDFIRDDVQSWKSSLMRHFTKVE